MICLQWNGTIWQPVGVVPTEPEMFECHFEWSGWIRVGV